MIYVTKVRFLKINPSKGKLTEVHDLAFLVKSWGLLKSPFPTHNQHYIKAAKL